MKATASISLVIASILAASALVMPAASAAPANFELSTSTVLSAGSSLYSPEEVDALAQELEKIFTDYVTAGKMEFTELMKLRLKQTESLVI